MNIARHDSYRGVLVTVALGLKESAKNAPEVKAPPDRPIYPSKIHKLADRFRPKGSA